MSAAPLHHTIMGEDPRPPMILLHGFAGDRETWLNVQTALAPHRRSIAFDLPGHGRERARPVGDARVLADAVAASLDAMNLSRIHLAGHSMGGAVAAVLALSAPERIASLTLLAPGGFGPEINHRLLRRFGTARAEGELAAIVDEFFGFASPVPRFIAKRLAEERSDPATLAPLQTILDAILDGPSQRTLPTSKLAALPCPLKVLWGTQDRMVPTRQSHGLPGLVATHVFAGLGHMVHLEAPHETVRLLLEAMACA